MKKTKLNHELILLYTDGGCQGNPGPGAMGIIICDKANNSLKEYAECIEYCTSNQAEYKALIRGLELCAEFTRGEVVCISDSELMIRQMKGEYSIRDRKLYRLYQKAKERAKIFEDVIFRHFPRKDPMIKRVDDLGRQVMKPKVEDDMM
jgi:ribonuclease HI